MDTSHLLSKGEKYMQQIAQAIAEKILTVDEPTIQKILDVLVERGYEFPYREIPAKVPDKFLGENPPINEYEGLSPEQRGDVQDAMARSNKEWLRNKYNTLNAVWLMVMNGEVIAHGASLTSYPDEEWNPTNIPEDWYPTVELTLERSDGRKSIAPGSRTENNSRFRYS